MNRTHPNSWCVVYTNEDGGLYTYTVSSSVTITVTSSCIMLLLLVAARAVVFSTKLPNPFKTACKVLLAADMLLVLVTGIEPWLANHVQFDSEVTDFSVVLVTLSTALSSMERAAAFKIPLRYIRFSGNESRMAIILALTTFSTVIMIYLFLRCLVCLVLIHKDNGLECSMLQRHFVLSSAGIFLIITSMCLALVVHIIMKNRRQNTRRNTRMGLPQNHASSATDNHITAMLFLLYPCALGLLMSCLFLPYCHFISDRGITVKVSVAYRFLFLVVHGILFNTWFDESRLHLLTLLSPYSATIRLRVDEMRINIYNIVISTAFQSARQSTSSISSKSKSRRTGLPLPQENSSQNVRISNVSMFLSSRSPSQSSIVPVDGYSRAKISQLENISEIEA